jgi:hypothetical protein
MRWRSRNTGSRPGDPSSQLHSLQVELSLECPSDGSRDPGSPVDSPLVDQSKTVSGRSTRSYRATTSSGLSRPTTPTNNSGGMIKVHILNCVNDRRLGPYKSADQRLRLGSALRVPASPTGRLVGRLGLAYQRAPGVGTKDKDEPRGPPVVHGQPLPQRGLWQQGALFHLPVLVKG